MIVEHPVRVIYGDTDQMGVVYYANYLRFFEGARATYLREHGVSYRDVFERELGLMMPVTEAAVSYRAPARYDELLTVRVALTELGRASARFDYRVLRDGEELARGHTQHACCDLTGKVRRIPDALRLRLPGGDRFPSPEAPAR